MTSDQNLLKIGLVQMNSGIDEQKNLETALYWLNKAKQKSCDLVSLPEVVNLVDKNSERLAKSISYQDDNPFLKGICDFAQKEAMAVHIGSLALKNDHKNSDEKSDEKSPFAVNRGFYINRKGRIKGHYDKIHMFDVQLAGGESYLESDSFSAGNDIALIKSPWGQLGLTICYDLRFSWLYRELVRGGATIIFVPAAFTATTGQAHWHALLRARAIENSCYIIAAAQGGLHEDGRKTYGHSMIINPWGEIIAEKDDDEVGLLTAKIDLSLIETYRHMIPAWTH